MDADHNQRVAFLFKEVFLAYIGEPVDDFGKKPE